MSKSPSPEMKFFRWILSHLTLIIVLSLILYIYWNRDDIWPEEIVKDISPVQLKDPEGTTEKTIPVAAESQDMPTFASELPAPEAVQQTQPRPQPQNKSPEYPAETAKPPSASDFAERMRRYRLSLPVAERTAMDNAEQVFQQVADGTIKFPDEAAIGVKTTAENTADKKKGFAEPEKTEEILRHSAPNFRPPSSPQSEVIISAENKLQNSKVQVKKKKPETKHSKDLQKQIRNRQKQLQKQMVMLIPLTTDKKTTEERKVIRTIKPVKLKTVKPVINTPQQRLLLQQARQAFDSKNFILAEKKYLQLSRELPELPDIIGELANVYRTQNRIPEYLQSSIQFVNRLVAHHRFNEAWKVVSATDKLDKKTAEQMRRLIKSKKKG